MSRSITFVTKSHNGVFQADETGSAEILDRQDVNRIASDLSNDALTQSRLELERLSNENKCALREMQASEQAQIKRLDAIDRQFREFPDMVKETLREVLLSQLQPLLDSAKANIDSLLKDNCDFKNTVSSLSVAIDSAKADIAHLQTVNDELRNGIDSLRANLSACQVNLDAPLNPPKKQGFFQRQYFRMVKFFQRKTSANTTTPPPKGTHPCP